MVRYRLCPSESSHFDLTKAREVYNDTLRGLESLTYRIPNDHQLIDFICEFHPGGEEERTRRPPESVQEFASRFEPDIVFPGEEWGHDKMATGIITGRNATFSLLVIGGAKMRLEAAHITAVYLQRGGDSHLRGMELEADLAMRVGEEIAALPIPLFGEEKPTAGTIRFLMQNAQSMYR